GFAQDVQRYLADEPVHACPPSMWYRFGKFARRHTAALVAAAAVVLAVLLTVGSLAVSTALFLRENHQKEEALTQKGQALTKAEQEEKAAKESLARSRAQARRAEGNFQQTLLAVDEWVKVAPEGETYAQSRALGGSPEVRALHRLTLKKARMFFEDF